MSFCNTPTKDLNLYNDLTVNMVQSSYDVRLRHSEFPEEVLPLR